MKRKTKKKIWLDKRSKKYQHKKYRKRRHGRNSNTIVKNEKKGRVNENNSPIIESIKNVPEKFSFTENAPETIEFFYDIVQDIKKKIYGKVFSIDSKRVNNVSVDALIYLIAIMQNIKINYNMKYTFRGNLPENQSAAQIYIDSGFMSYVTSKKKRLPDSNDKIQIKSGKRTDPVVASEFCKFVMKKLNKTIADILPIQKVLIELMSNVYHHAYNSNDEDDIMRNQWYMYAEHKGERVHFIFVDTGYGIPKTVRKNNYEKIKSFINSKSVDADLIYSTLHENFRTETGEEHRGNGLPGVRELAMSKPFETFKIISGKGSCLIDKDNSILKTEYNNKVYGTMFIFDII